MKTNENFSKQPNRTFRLGDEFIEDFSEIFLKVSFVSDFDS